MSASVLSPSLQSKLFPNLALTLMSARMRGARARARSLLSLVVLISSIKPISSSIPLNIVVLSLVCVFALQGIHSHRASAPEFTHDERKSLHINNPLEALSDHIDEKVPKAK